MLQNAIAVLTVAAAGIGAVSFSPTARAIDPELSVLTVSFAVTNTNSTPRPCPVDNKPYTVRGHITGPKDWFLAAGPKASTLYVHGHSFGEFLWRYDGVPGYNHVEEMAKLGGHISVTYDRLGYESSDKPNGKASCYASEADVVDQIVGLLRAGDYQVMGGPAVAFDRIALAGHSQGAIVNEGAASFFQSVDALVHISFAGLYGTPPLLIKFATNLVGCIANPQTANQEPGAPSGYAFRGRNDREFQKTNFVNADPAVVADITAMRNVDPCGFPNTVIAYSAANVLTDFKVKVPVLLIFGAKDPNFLPLGPRLFSVQFAGSEDKTFERISNTGHAVMLERTAPMFREILSGWLDARGF